MVWLRRNLTNISCSIRQLIKLKKLFQGLGSCLIALRIGQIWAKILNFVGLILYMVEIILCWVSECSLSFTIQNWCLIFDISIGFPLFIYRNSSENFSWGSIFVWGFIINNRFSFGKFRLYKILLILRQFQRIPFTCLNSWTLLTMWLWRFYMLEWARIVSGWFLRWNLLFILRRLNLSRTANIQIFKGTPA